MTRTEHIARAIHKEAYINHPARDAAEMVLSYDLLPEWDRKTMDRMGFVVEEVVRLFGHAEYGDLRETCSGALCEDYFSSKNLDYDKAPDDIKNNFRFYADVGLKAYLSYGMGETKPDEELTEVKAVKL